MAKAISNAVIVSTRYPAFTWCFCCSSCGFLDKGNIKENLGSGTGRRMEMNKICPKCSRMRTIKIET